MAAKPIALLLLLLCAAGRLYAQADPVDAQLPEVEVRSSRLTFSAGNRSSSADSLLMALHRQSGLVELLQKVAPVFVKSYGPGNLATLSVRGTTANQTALVWNGIQINSPTTGLTDLNLIAPGSVQLVQLVHGPQSALYGSGAVGGTLFLGSQPVARGGQALELSQAVGSFGSLQTRTGGSYRGKKWSGRSYYQYASARNDFPFTNFYHPERPTQRTTHAAFAQHNLSQDLFFNPTARSSASLHAWYTSAGRQIPPVMSVPVSVAEQKDRALRLCGVGKHQSAAGTTNARLGYLTDYLLYLNPQLYWLMPEPARTATWLAEAEHAVQYRQLSVNIGASARHTLGKVAEYGRPVQLTQQAVFLSVRQKIGQGTTLAASARKEVVTGFNPEPTFSVGFEQWLARSGRLVLKGQAANSFRVPTLNERYWQPGGKPDLKPERGTSVEAGLAFRAKKVRLAIEQAELTVYSSQMRDQIVWRPVTAVVYSPVNLDRVWARGAELSAVAKWQALPEHKTSISIRSAYHYTQSTQEGPTAGAAKGKQLVYVPLHTASVFTAIESRWINAGWQQSWNAEVFTSSDNRHFLPAFALTDLLAWSPELAAGPFTFFLKAAVRNVFNTTYQTVRNVPMPGRSYEIRIQLLLPFQNQTSNHE